MSVVASGPSRLAIHIKLMLGSAFGPCNIQFRSDRTKGRKISVVFLSGGNLTYDSIQISFEFRIALDTKLIGGALDHFVYIGIIVSGALVETFGQTPCNSEVVDSTRFFTTLQTSRYGHATACSQTRGPESIIKMDMCEFDRLDRIIGAYFAGNDPAGLNGENYYTDISYSVPGKCCHKKNPFVKSDNKLNVWQYRLNRYVLRKSHDII
jgi:hypothetical protein